LNLGQLVKIIRAQYLVPAESYPKVKGHPFKIEELESRIRQALES
jgi:2-oxoglutarate ferredoxin oxidoreductase subunit alpha